MRSSRHGAERSNGTFVEPTIGGPMETIAAKALCGVIERALIAEGVAPPIAKILAERACQPAVEAGARKVTAAGRKAVRSGRRKVSKYNREFGKQLKRLKAKHKRTPVSGLMARAHAATRRALK